MESKSSEERVQIVDMDNKPLRGELRRIMRKENLIHRASYVFIYNTKKQLYVQKRTSTKDYLPGYYTLCTGGVVLENEQDLDSAIREVQEEMGIEKPDLRFIQRFYYGDDRTRVWGNIYLCPYDGDIKWQKEEVEYVEMWGLEEVCEKVKSGTKIAPDSLTAFKLIENILKTS